MEPRPFAEIEVFDGGERRNRKTGTKMDKGSRREKREREDLGKHGDTRFNEASW